jgi:hypothetical protein
LLSNAPDWFPDWTGQTGVIVASGPSAKDVPLELARGVARFITINSSWQLAPWADVLYGCDFAWWRSVGGCPEFLGLKISQDRRAINEAWGIKKIDLKRGDNTIEFERPGIVGWGSNSGFHSLNLAIQFGCSKILLVGYDMRLDGGLHWHGSHPKGMNNPNITNIAIMRSAVDGVAKSIAERGIRVINCSPVSALENYPKMEFAEALSE